VGISIPNKGPAREDLQAFWRSARQCSETLAVLASSRRLRHHRSVFGASSPGCHPLRFGPAEFRMNRGFAYNIGRRDLLLLSPKKTEQTMLRSMNLKTGAVDYQGYVPPLFQPLLDAASAGNDLVPVIDDITQAFGFDTFNCSVSMCVHPHSKGLQYVFTTMPAAWVAIYDQRAFVEVDPTRPVADHHAASLDLGSGFVAWHESQNRRVS
jgi:Autoinducer binding domain